MTITHSVPFAPSRSRSIHPGAWRRSIRLRRTGLPAALLSLLLVFGVASAATPARAEDAPPPATEAPSFVILIDGLCTELASGDAQTADFAGADGLAARLVAAGFPADAIASYGYSGGSVDDSGHWRPAPYTCADSRDQSLAADVERLDGQLTAMARANAGASFHLVGFSLGGAVAFGYLGRVTDGEAAALPNGGRLASVTTLDAPLGGAPFVELLCGFAPDVCGGVVPASSSALRDFSAIWASGAGEPAGAHRSIESRVSSSSATNQEVAAAAAAKGIAVLTIGNVRDWVYAPAGPGKGPVTFLDTQWVVNELAGAGVHARVIDSGPGVCPDQGGGLAAAFNCNHPLVLRDPAVAGGVLALLNGSRPAVAQTCPGGLGGCLALPPRPPVALRSTIAAGLVSGGGKFGTAPVTVRSGGRATLLVATSPALAGAVIQIWGRAAGGTFRFLTSRVADGRGIVRYFTPPITGEVAIQARYVGDFLHAPAVSPSRVITVR